MLSESGTGIGVGGGIAFLQAGRILQEDRDVRCQSTGSIGELGDGGSVAWGVSDIMAAVTMRRRCHGERQGVPFLHVIQQ